MPNSYIKMISKGVDCTENDVKDVCVFISMLDTTYPMAFIDYEDDGIIGVNYTVKDGTERFVIINKEHIVDVGIVYEQDFHMEHEDEEESLDMMYQ